MIRIPDCKEDSSVLCCHQNSCTSLLVQHEKGSCYGWVRCKEIKSGSWIQDIIPPTMKTLQWSYLNYASVLFSWCSQGLDLSKSKPWKPVVTFFFQGRDIFLPGSEFTIFRSRPELHTFYILLPAVSCIHTVIPSIICVAAAWKQS